MSDTPDLSGTLSGARSYDRAAMMTRIAAPNDIDELGHVNNAVYLIWAQDIAVAHWRTMTTEELRHQYIWMALRHEIDYRDQVFEGDTVEIRTWLGDVSGARFARHVDIRKTGASRPAATVMTDWCLIDAQSRKPRRVSQEILDLFGL